MSDTSNSPVEGKYDAKVPETAPVETEVDEKTVSSTFSEDYDVNDAKDPKNWSNTKKHLVFLALMSSSVLADG
jgi:hypothetical protein